MNALVLARARKCEGRHEKENEISKTLICFLLGAALLDEVIPNFEGRYNTQNKKKVRKRNSE